MTGGLEAEGRHSIRKGEVVIDSLGYVGNPDLPLGRLGHLKRSECRIVAADGHEMGDAQLLERLDGAL